MTTIILSVLYECISFICSHGRQSLELSIYLRNHLAEAQVCYHIRNHQLRVCFFRFSAYFFGTSLSFFLPSLPPFSTLFFPTQCYYSLGTLHLLSKNYKEALKYFKKHLNLAQELNDKYTPTLNMSYMYPILKTNAKNHK